MNSNPWFVKPQNNYVLEKKIRIFCFPYAGGSAATFLSWPKQLPTNVELIAVQPPGRAARLFEPAFKDMESLINELINNISGLLDEPYVFFGHSLGSRIAFELMCRCEDLGYPLPITFIASGSRGPHLSPRKTSIYNLPDREFINELKDMNGTPDEILNNEELMSLCLPLLRADFELADRYKYTETRKFRCPIAVLSGTEDSDISEEDLKSWGNYFHHPVTLEYFPGGHFFIEEQKDEVLAFIREILTRLTSEQLATELAID